MRAQSNSSQKFIKLLLLCMLLVANYYKGHGGVTNFDCSRGFKNKEKQLCQCLLVGTLPAGIPSFYIMNTTALWSSRKWTVLLHNHTMILIINSWSLRLYNHTFLHSKFYSSIALHLYDCMIRHCYQINSMVLSRHK